MARIRKTVFWTTRAVALLISFLFSAVQLTPPAWAKAAADPTSDAVGGAALTALIADFSRSAAFDRRLHDEYGRLQGVGGASGGSAARAQPMERFAQAPQPQQTITELEPLPKFLPKVLPQRAPQVQPPQADTLGGGTGKDTIFEGQPQQAIQAEPQQAPQAQPQQAILLPWSESPRSLPPRSQQQQMPGAQPQQAYISFKPGSAPGAQPQQAVKYLPQQAPNVQPPQLPAIQLKK